MQLPETRFTSAGSGRVAYQVFGQGPPDLVLTSGQWGHVDLDWEDPALARFLRRLAAFSRLIRFNARGSALSDRRPADGRGVVAHWAEDLVAVLDAARSSAAALVGWNDAGPFALPFAARHADRVSRLVLINTTARYTQAADYPEGHAREVVERFIAFTQKYWGTEKWARTLTPSIAADPRALQHAARMYRAVASPALLAENLALQLDLDARSVLPQVRTPTLVMARRDYRWVPAAQGRHIAAHVPGARFVEIPGSDATPYSETPDLILDLIEEFVTGVRRHGEALRALVAVLFTDIVDSTRRAAQLGDAGWRDLLDRHDAIQREHIELFGGRLVDSAGDGTLATFERPDRAIDCAHALHQALAALGLSVRAGVHFGDVELRDDGRVGGLAVHIGARVASMATPGELLVSRTVRDVLIGSRYGFEERGEHELRGVPGRWPIYRVGPTGSSAAA